MSIKPDLLKKKALIVYKAYIMKPDETMTLDPSGDEYALTIKDAVSAMLQKINDIKELESLKGSQVSILGIAFNMQKLEDNPHVDEIMQDGNYVSLAIKNFAYRMQIHKYILNDFTYSINAKDQGQTLVFDKIDLNEIK